MPSSGLLYVTIHLDDGLKKTTGWDRTILDAATLPPVTLNQCQPYQFTVSGDLTDGTTVRSWNEFKKNPGSAGNLLQNGTGNPKPNVKVHLLLNGKIVGTAITDSDGVWQISYKHTGKAQDYVLRLPDFNLQQTITLKANGFVIVNFENLP